ncbi:MAG: molybdopterin biosynthesis protein MoeB [Firmicutes bacterium HGW-Firmicutes-16]|nr:MAG: molybdopterin biosynthesis protein MoeB [Firmicutes bacterium HGW-Firmicutes-16]
MEERYSRSLGALTQNEIDSLKSKRVCVVGCGGLGGYVIELLARIGIGTLTVVDGDSFVLSNLNRQLLSTEALIGEGKANAAFERIQAINSEVRVNAVSEYLTEDNADSILKNHDIVLDALDNVSSRRILADSCGRLGLPLVHGAISGWCAQVTVIAPNTKAFDRIYPAETAVKQASSLSFTPALAASIQTAEAVKVLLGREVSLQSRLLFVDLLTQEYNTVII